MLKTEPQQTNVDPVVLEALRRQKDSDPKPKPKGPRQSHLPLLKPREEAHPVPKLPVPEPPAPKPTHCKSGDSSSEESNKDPIAIVGETESGSESDVGIKLDAGGFGEKVDEGSGAKGSAGSAGSGEKRCAKESGKTDSGPKASGVTQESAATGSGGALGSAAGRAGRHDNDVYGVCGRVFVKLKAGREFTGFSLSCRIHEGYNCYKHCSFGKKAMLSERETQIRLLRWEESGRHIKKEEGCDIRHRELGNQHLLKNFGSDILGEFTG